MPMDGLTLSLVTRELREALVGGRVDRITQPERDELNILVRNHGRNQLLLLSASAGCARAHITREKKVSPLEPPMLCMLLRKHISGGRVRDVRQINGDRILEVEFEHLDELGDSARKTLVCEFMGRHSNLILVDGEGRILECARRVTESMSSVREVLPGLRYERPPEHGKTPFDAPEEDIVRALQGASGPLHKAIAGAISGLSVQTARELAFRAAGNEDAHTQELDMEAVAPAVARALAAAQSEIAPALLFAETGEPVDVVAFPYLSRASLRSERFATISEAMDAFYLSLIHISVIAVRSTMKNTENTVMNRE